MYHGAMITDSGSMLSVTDHINEIANHDPLDILQKTPAGGLILSTGQAAIFNPLSLQEQKQYLWEAYGLVF